MMLANARLVQTTGMPRPLEGALSTRAAEGPHDLAKLNARLQAETRAREAAEAQVRQIQKMEALGQLTSGIAHDFANMLTIIMGNLEIIHQRLAWGRTNVVSLVEKAIDGGNRAMTLTHRLLAFSRKQSLTPEIVDVNALVSVMAELLRGTLGENVELECVCVEELWRTCVDPGQLENAVLNLAVNARDAMPGGGRLTIETQNADLSESRAAVRAEVPAGQYVVLAVTDTGTGMPPEVAAHAFDPFFTTKAEGRGTGLGLSQVHDFIEHSQGHIQILSELGHGTSLKMYLPRHIGGASVADTVDESAAKAADCLWHGEHRGLTHQQC